MSDAADKLARSRQAILEHIARRQRRHDPREVPPGDYDDPYAAFAAYEEPFEAGSGWFGRLQHAVRTWWHYHPASMAVELATPMMRSYARRKPLQLLAISAAAGAALTFVRPWRLISLTTLAVALLKDRNGVIDIDLPISGTLDDPQFSIGGVILKALGNLITRIVTAPFTLLANLVGGGGPELGYVEFTAGRASLSSASNAFAPWNWRSSGASRPRRAACTRTPCDPTTASNSDDAVSGFLRKTLTSSSAQRASSSLPA